MRPPPGCNPPDKIEPKSDTKRITQTRHYRLITPLFGGGVEPGQCDPVTVVRATEIRGHLRFWWRATRGGQFNGNLADMKRHEDALWGAAGDEKGGGPSKVEVVVHEFTENQRGKPFVVRSNKGEVSIGKPESPYSYVAFPLRDTPQLPVLENVHFSLTITFFRDDEKDVEAALWAWETFGGIGARTRRGFGALQLLKINDVETPAMPINTLRQSIFDGLQKHVVSGTWPLDVPHLRREPDSDWIRANLFSKRSALDVWVHLFSRLKAFRHQRPNNRGRNHWPEPDAIRKMTGSYHPKHRNPINTTGKFPRAAFGLPIMFEFKRDDQRGGDPSGKNELNGKSESGQKYERWGSPLILRPVAGSDGAIGLALIFANTRLPARLVIETQNGSKAVEATLTEAEARTIMKADNRTPLLGNKTNILLAFLDTL